MGHMTLRKLHLPEEYIDISNVCYKKNLMIYHELKYNQISEVLIKIQKKKKKKERKYNND